MVFVMYVFLLPPLILLLPLRDRLLRLQAKDLIENAMPMRLPFVPFLNFRSLFFVVAVANVGTAQDPVVVTFLRQ